MPNRLPIRVFLLMLVLLAACSPESSTNPSPLPMVAAGPTLTPFQPGHAPAAGAAPARPIALATTTARATPETRAASTLWIDPASPRELSDLLGQQGFAPATSPESADIRLGLAESAQAGSSTWIYALVAAFPTVMDGVTLAELRDCWSGSSGPGLVMTESTYAAMQNVFGAPAGGRLDLVPAESLKARLWQEPGLWGIVPFEALEPELKVLEIDGRSPIHKDFSGTDYPLKAHFSLKPEVVGLPASNRDPAKLVTVLMTGTTALVRAISFKMQQNGVEYPARDIGGWLRDADILHISNEVAFSPDCPAPNPNDGSLRFCSAVDNIGLLEGIGVDVIELSGNHVNDWGRDALSYSLDLYRQRGWPVFAGGADLVSAQQPAILERGGQKFAFIGCNAPGPDFAWATASGPGSAPCGDYGWLVEQIRQLKASGDVVIVTLQHYEYYSPEPRPLQLEDFRRLAEAGADLVSGSQAHYSQAFEFDNGVFIHFGLGNLFFDQMGYDYADGTRTTNTRREFLDRHVFYGGRLISSELLTAVLEDYSKPRPMTADERAAFLSEYFTASGWQP
jgi:poly-gamma-glutamate synthesis protein (capsule biosynthesis protein)